LTLAKQLEENLRVSFQGTSKKAAFDISGAVARQWLPLPNPNGRPNSDVVRPWANGLVLAGRASDLWIVDYGCHMAEADAALYEAPFAHVIEHVKSVSAINRDPAVARSWWRLARPRPDMRAALNGLPRYIATIAHSKHRYFVWFDAIMCPDQALIVIARADDATFGILHSRFHELWSLRLCTWLGVGNDPRYTPTTTFETFPFPAGLTPRDTAPNVGNWTPASAGVTAQAIAAAAQRLNQLRENWLNPPEWTERIPEIVLGYPDRIVAKPGFEAELKKRTLTNLYNVRPAWLVNAHQALDTAVAEAYGWADYTSTMPDEEILRRLLALNLERCQNHR
jgi:type II restriction/modification system DNA methylase subunit YeeA